MSVLTLNGIAIPVAPNGVNEDLTALGEDSRAVDGTLRRTERAAKRSWACKSPLLDPPTRKALRGIVRGDGHVWNFDADLFSSRGLAPSSVSGTVNTATKKRGAGSLALLEGQSVSWPVGRADGAPFTLAAWRYYGGAWAHSAMVFDGAATRRWLNGERNDVTGTTWMHLDTGGILTVDNGLPTGVCIDDLVYLPFALPDAWAPGLFAVASVRAMPLLPRLLIDGDAVDGAVEVLGTLGGIGYEPAMYSGALVAHGKLDFTLTEV